MYNCSPFLSLVILATLLTSGILHSRTWTQTSSGRTLEADFVKITGDNITVKRNSDGKEFTLLLSKLSIRDRTFVAKQVKPVSPSNNTSAKDLYKDVKSFKVEDIPTTGDAHRKLDKVDAVILEFMVEHGIPAVSFAVSKNRKILHDRAFGWDDSSLSTPLPVGRIMRLASMSKPITHAAVNTLIADKKLSMDDKPFEILKLKDLKSDKFDDRWKDITIEHLLKHKGGFDRAISGDSTFKSKSVCKDLGIKLDEMTPMDLVRWYLQQPLDFKPGERDAYSNFGYILLARVVEKVGGKPYVDFLQTTIGKESGMTAILVSRTEPQDRNPNEIWYCLHPEFTKPITPFPMRFETKDGAGSLACSASDYCRFLEHYTIGGKPRRRGANYKCFFGSTYGTTSVCSQRADGISYAAICNRRGKGDLDWNKKLKAKIDEALNEVAGKL